MSQEAFLESVFFQRLIIGLVTAFLILIVSRVASRLAARYIVDTTRLYQTTRTIRTTSGLLILATILVLIAPRPGDVVTIITVVGAGLAIATREALLSVLGWTRILLNTPFKQGDRIEINGVRGDVIDIRVLRTTLMEIGGWVNADQSTGRIVHIPNAWIYLYALHNYTRGFTFIWHEMAVTVTFDSDWEAAQEIMRSLAEESARIVAQQATKEIHQMSREYLIHYSILTPFVYVKIVPEGVRLTLRFLTEARKRRGSEHAITMELLKQFKAHGNIQIAHATTRVVHHGSPQFEKSPSSLHS